ncbi:hypothetical protein [Microbacterium sp.]|uniref:hypothetical protein n=1 Tax=Microbacterium sp. TaxID=51671 RepID=UPI0039E6C7FC
MSLRRIPGKDQEYYLISYDKHGDERPDADGTHASAEALEALQRPGADVTDVFILCHGWQGDYDGAIAQYDRWLGAANPDAADDGIRPFVIGVHWPSRAWSDRELKSAPTGLLGEEAPDDDAMSIEEAVDEYAAVLPEGEGVRAALQTVLAYASEIDPDEDATDRSTLPAEVTRAYRTLAEANAVADGDDPLLGSGWDPDEVFQATCEAPSDDGLLGGGLFHKLREAVLGPLRQLTFWHCKNQAREFGERGAAQLVREIMAATPEHVRVHLMGHSFGTIAMSAAVRGPGKVPQPPVRPVASLYLVQGAVSLWAFAEQVPARVGGGRGYFADVVRPEFVAGPIVVTRSSWDYAVGRFYPLAVRLAGQYLLGDELPKYGGIGAFGMQGAGAVELPPLEAGETSPGAELSAGIRYNIDASAVIKTLQGASGAHSDLAHSELVWLGWRAALVGR